jgi:hypothetical protein
VLAAFAFVASLAPVATGLQTDDYALRYELTHGRGLTQGFGDRLLTLPSLQEQGFPWWFESSHRQRFLRPLSSVTHWLDFRLWPDAPSLMHLENSVLYALLVAAVCFCYRVLGLSALAAGFSGLFYAVSGAHGASVGWISARNTLLYTLFAVLTLGLYHRARVQGSRSARVFAPLCLVLGLASGEGAVGIVGYLAAHAIFVDRAQPRLRLLGLLPYLGIVVLWRIYYVTAGYGAHGGDWYLDVGEHPIRFAIAALEALPIYLATQLTVPLASLSILGAGFMYGLVALSVCTLVLLWPVFRTVLIGSPLARLALFGATGSVVPLGATQVQDRIATLVALGTCMLLGLLVEQSWRVAESGAPSAAANRFASILYVMHLHVALPIFVAGLFSAAALSKKAEAIVDVLARSDSTRSVLVNLPSAITLLYPVFIADSRGQAMPGSFYSLYAGASGLHVTRVDDQTIEITPDRGYPATPMERLHRSLDDPFVTGQTRQLRHMQVEVMSVDGKGAPRKVRFRFDTSLADACWQLLAWQGGKPVTWNPPPIGETVALASVGSL